MAGTCRKGNAGKHCWASQQWHPRAEAACPLGSAEAHDGPTHCRVGSGLQTERRDQPRLLAGFSFLMWRRPKRFLTPFLSRGASPFPAPCCFATNRRALSSMPLGGCQDASLKSSRHILHYRNSLYSKHPNGPTSRLLSPHSRFLEPHYIWAPIQFQQYSLHNLLSKSLQLTSGCNFESEDY